MTYTLPAGLEAAMKIAEIQKTWTGITDATAIAMKWQAHFPFIGNEIFQPAIALSEKAALAAKVFGDIALHQHAAINFKGMLSTETFALTQAIASMNESINVKIGSILAGIDSPLAKQVQQIGLAFQSNINAIANSGILFGRVEDIIGAKNISQRTESLFSSIDEHRQLTKADLEKAKQEIIVYIREQIETKKFIGFSTEFWLGAILSLLSILFTIHYAYHPPVVSAEEMSQHDLVQFQQDLLIEVQKIQHTDTVRRVVNCNTWLRELPRFASARLCALRKETIVYVTNSNSGWAYVLCEDQKGEYPVNGWIRKECLFKKSKGK